MLRALLIGDTARPEFHEACEALEELAKVTRFADTESATTALCDGPLAPHAIVLAQTYPGQFPPRAIERLRAAAPLARWIALLGSWCEGEPRSGRPLPGVVRIYWHEAAARFRRELPRWFDRDSAWPLPITASEDERMLAASASAVPRGGGLVAIWSRRQEMADFLADACRSAGYATVSLHPRQPGRVQGAAAAIFDGDSLDGTALEEITKLAAHVSPASVLVLLGAPRTQDVRAVRSLGGRVVAKPFRVDELLWELDAVTLKVGSVFDAPVNKSFTQRRKGAKTQTFV